MKVGEILCRSVAKRGKILKYNIAQDAELEVQYRSEDTRGNEMLLFLCYLTTKPEESHHVVCHGSLCL
jgi:aminoglycoside phosphotransferase